jgi:hypothetical protein
MHEIRATVPPDLVPEVARLARVSRTCPSQNGRYEDRTRLALSGVMPPNIFVRLASILSIGLTRVDRSPQREGEGDCRSRKRTETGYCAEVAPEQEVGLGAVFRLADEDYKRGGRGPRASASPSRVSYTFDPGT